MKNIKTILVPLDGSAVAEAALAPAVELAREASATLILMRAAEPRTLPLGDPIEDPHEVMREAREYLAATRARLMGAGVHSIDVSVWSGPPAEAIVRAAQSRNADLIVMSSHGRTGLARLAVGRTFERVLRTTTVPILLIPPARPQANSASLSATEVANA